MILARLNSLIRRFRRDRRGLSAVEFALIAPMMIGAYLSSVELSDAMIIDRKVTAAASAVGDLVAQAQAISDDNMTDIFTAAASILAPYPITTLEIVVTSVVTDGNGDSEVAWSDGYNTGARAVGSTVTLPDGLAVPGRSVIMSEVTYSFAPSIGHAFTGTISLTDQFYLRPRRTINVTRL